MIKVKSLYVAAVLVVFSFAPLRADTVIMEGGFRYEGKIVSVDERFVKIRTGEGMMILSRDAILFGALTGSGGRDVVVMEGGHTYKGKVVSLDGSLIKIRTPEGLQVLALRKIVGGYLSGGGEEVSRNTGRTGETVSERRDETRGERKEESNGGLIFSENFENSSTWNKWRDVSREYGDGWISIKKRSGDTQLTASRGNKHYGWAEVDIPIGRSDFEFSYTCGGLTRDAYDRGAVYFYDNSGKLAYVLQPDNYRNRLTLLALDYDSRGERRESAVVCERKYNLDDGRHTYTLVKRGNTFFVSEDGNQKCVGSFSRAGDQWHDDITKVRFMGRGSNRGSGLYYDNITVRRR